MLKVWILIIILNGIERYWIFQILGLRFPESVVGDMVLMSEGTSIWNCYKRRCELQLIFTVSHLISLKFYISIGSILAWLIITQSQLVGYEEW